MNDLIENKRVHDKKLRKSNINEIEFTPKGLLGIVKVEHSALSISEVQKFYAGKNIFITGGTGFLGICLIEKILRCCPDVGKIYLLMRPKKGKDINERVIDLSKNLIFERLIEEKKSDRFQKLIPIPGDVGESSLGISIDDRKILINDVHIVFHSAATLDFQASLKPTVSINLLGTRRVAELCKEIKNLKALVHVSSAYVNAFLLSTKEILYPAPEDAEKVIKYAETLSETALEELAPGLIKDHPNTYTFTKHLAEHEVNKIAALVPCGIVRPSMITAAWKEPIPGWTISKNGPQGFLMGASKGVVRRLPVSKGLVYDYIPVDTVVNQLIVTAYHVDKESSGKLSIFHCTSSTYKPFTWKSVDHKINGYLHSFPLKSAVWYPHLKLLPSLWMFKISAIFVHFLPAYLLDFITRLFGGRPILVRLHTNVNQSLGRLAKFIFTEWMFDNSRTLLLSKSLSDADRKYFNIDIAELEWEEYFVSLTQGVRRYLSNENPKSIPVAKKKDQMLLIFHILLQVFVYGLLWLITALITGASVKATSWVVPLAYILFSFF